ncbi:MAG: hypothetical protein LBM96_12090 [Methanobrevibacter sp.]|jgi:hypothetical protein|nr:hypothetical protein [Candidatus Methanoflexus mossambicus]
MNSKSNNLKRTTIYIESEYLKQIKLKAIEEDTTQTKVINDYIEECLLKDEKIESENMKTIKNLEIDSKLLNTIKRLANEKSTSVNEVISNFLKNAVEKEETNIEKIKRMSINHQMPFYDEIINDPDSASLNDIIGIGDINYEIDPIELKDNIHFRF